jgi:Zn finger protein HypA/HybF involved in hydrogenase expression
MTCQDCQHTYSPQEALSCPECHSIHVWITAGEEFYLEAIDVTRTETRRVTT